MRGPWRSRVVVVTTMDEDCARRVVEVRMGTRPDVLVCRQTLRLVGGLGIEAGALVPKSRLVDVSRIIVSPEENAGGVGKQHGVHERLLWQSGQFFPTTTYRIRATIQGHG